MKKKRTLFIFSLILLSIQMVLTADKISGMEADTEETDYNQEELSSAPDDNISFPEDVRVVPKGTVVDIDEDHSLVTVWQSPVEIFKGDTFIVYLQDLPIGYEALAVEKKGESASIFVQKADNTIFASVEESGELELTCENSEFFPAGGVEVIHDPFNDVESAGLTYDKDNKKLSLAVSLGSADAEVYLSNMSLSHTFSGGNLSISLSGSWGIETGVSQKLDSLAEVPLGEIRIAGVGKISLTFSMTQEMSVKATFTGAFRTGLTIDQNGVGKATKSFSVSQKNVTGEGIISASLKVTGGVDILVASADVYAEIGVKTEYKGETHTVNEDKIVFCEDFKYHLFSNVGAEAKYYSIMTDQMESIYSSELELAGEETSPIRLRMHFENGKNVGGCTLGTEAPNKQYGGVTTINSTVLSDNRGRISETNISLPYDMEVPSDFVISNGNVNLNGHTLVINGNLIHENGTLTIGAGTLVIHGDYRIQKGSAGTSGSQVYSDSTGALNMSNSNGTLTIDGDLVIQSGSSMNISSGTLNLNGNLKQYRTQQNDKAISFGTSLNLTMTNAASHLIYFENGECSIGKMIMQNDVTITSDATIGNVTVDAHNLTANGNLKHATGTTNLDCGTLTVMGNLLQTGGTIFVNGGILDVGGDYYIAGSRTVGNDGKETVTGCYGCLQMTNANDEVYVAGNFLTAGGGHTDYLTKGIMYLHGNFSQRSLNNGYSFNAKGSHKVKFEGTGRHGIYFQKYDYSGFANVEFDEYADIRLQSYIRGFTLAENINLTIETNAFGVSGTLDLNGHVPNGLTLSGAPFTFSTGTLKLGGCTVEVVKDLVQSGGTLDLDAGSLKVRGAILQKGGTMYIDNGSLEVAGDYYIAGSREIDNTGTEVVTGCYGILQMTKTGDTVYVGGNFLTAGGGHTDYLTAGTMYVKGDFTQKKNNNSYSFNAKGTHKVVLNGRALQNVSFSSYSSSRFNILVIRNDLSHITFSPNPCWVQFIDESADVKPDFILPSTSALRVIEEEAFMNSSFTYVYLPDSVTTIAARAFANCGSLEIIRIPQNTTAIAADAFSGVTGLTIYGETGSYAESYAKTRGFYFEAE